MGINLIVTRRIDSEFNETGKIITRDAWKQLIDNDPELRVRTEEHVFINPRTDERISFPAGDLEAEFLIDGNYETLLQYRDRGDLLCGYSDSLDDPENPIRIKIAQVAKNLGALITHDAGDEILEW